MDSNHFDLYQLIVRDCTTKFSKCSKEVIAIEASLKEQHRREDLAQLLRTLQEAERDKLQAVHPVLFRVSYVSLIRVALVHQTAVWQAAQHKQRAATQAQEHGHTHSHSHDHAHDVAAHAYSHPVYFTPADTDAEPAAAAAAAPAESSPEYFHSELGAGAAEVAAVRQAVFAAVARINDVLDELRGEIADLTYGT
jgi:hypothetical protein